MVELILYVGFIVIVVIALFLGARKKDGLARYWSRVLYLRELKTKRDADAAGRGPRSNGP